MRFVFLPVFIAGFATAPAGGFAQEWVRCGEEGEQCRFAGTKLVRYGASDQFRFGTFTDGVACSNGVFGDPIEGTRKWCWTYQTPGEAAQARELSGRQRAARLREQLRSHMDQIDQLRAEVESRAAHINRLQDYIGRLGSQREEEINQLQTEVQSRDRRIDELEERVDRLRRRLEWRRSSRDRR